MLWFIFGVWADKSTQGTLGSVLSDYYLQCFGNHMQYQRWTTGLLHPSHVFNPLNYLSKPLIDFKRTIKSYLYHHRFFHHIFLSSILYSDHFYKLSMFKMDCIDQTILKNILQMSVTWFFNMLQIFIFGQLYSQIIIIGFT